MRLWFYVVVGLQIVFLLGEVAKTEMAISRGQVVTLKVAPVDPRSLFMGNYMDLSYDISAIDLSTVKHDAPVGAFGWHKTVYVSLLSQKPWAVAQAVTLAPPSAGETTPYLRGQVEWKNRSTIRIQYGLERYLIPEKKQEEVNRLQWWRTAKRPQITVEMSVTKKGQGFIRRVLVDGKPLGF